MISKRDLQFCHLQIYVFSLLEDNGSRKVNVLAGDMFTFA
jgi:hypothetical protein